ncbi:(Citrate (pro-3S)-lyase) ligase [Carnobacterium maltaromaticum]|uniref:[citrate (pro-3S)-lyase] ligase n=1 Tax=Carnobacterium maltaromaticum TaxID=2751 RepID=UPI00191BA605|nr:[citrate (pro-3S)-lyase] ligase [Carnobacterium maltaromaticum]CAD5896689.1 (Citrate (pro-3S)-lyase) ligase [Carnobacterium maltaromaticum]
MVVLQVKDLYLQNPYHQAAWQKIVLSENLRPEHNLSYTAGIYAGDQLVGTGSLQNNVIKEVAILKEYQGGEAFNLLLSHLMVQLSNRGYYHYFVFTKPFYQQTFEHIGFKVVATTKEACLLEKGNHSIADFVKKISKEVLKKNQQVGCIVMHANPFTNGHLYLIEKAAERCQQVIVFVVETNGGMFSYGERLALVKAGINHLKNVAVVGGGAYMVNFATFPSYFIEEEDQVIHYQTILDATIFKERIAPTINCAIRFVGEEPFSHTTYLYNQALIEVLPPEILVEVIPRKKNTDNQTICASKVREMIRASDSEKLSDFVPPTTRAFIEEKYHL